MKYLGAVTDPRDIATKQYVDQAVVGGVLHSAGRRRKAAAWAPSSAVGWNRIDWDTTDLADGVTVGTQASRLTVTVAGRYHIETQAAFVTPAEAGAAFVIALYRNGTRIESTQTNSHTGSSIAAVAATRTILDLTTTDYLEVYVYLNSAGTFTWLPLQGHIQAFMI